MIVKKIISFLLGIGLSFPLCAQENFSESAQEPEQKIVQYQWADFLMGNPCSVDFNRLKEKSFLTKNQEKLKSAMQEYCVGKTDVWDHLLITFYANKKNLLVDKTLKENGPIMRYIKVIPYWLVSIHKRYPTGDSLMAKLDRIENALQDRNPEKVLFLVQDLTPTQQIFLIPIFNEASQLVAFKKTLEQENNYD